MVQASMISNYKCLRSNYQLFRSRCLGVSLTNEDLDLCDVFDIFSCSILYHSITMATDNGPIHRHLINLLSNREYPKTTCPSEIARALSQAELDTIEVGTWREAMPQVRELAFGLRNSGSVEILQKGEVLPLSITQETVRGPIRLRKARDKSL